MTDTHYDLIIIGAGPAGYIAAERAGHFGKKVLLIEKAELGGICLNWGCIPTKCLLNSAKIFYQSSHGAAYGVQVDNPRFDLATAMKRKETVQAQLRQGIAGLMKKFKVDVVRGEARLLAADAVMVDQKRYSGNNILVCSGSSPAQPPIPGAEAPHVLDSTGILQIERLPKRLCVIGGGVIGVEFACFFGSIGVPVTVIEMCEDICPGVDTDLARILRAELAKKNIDFHCGCAVTGIEADTVRYKNASGTEESCPADLVLLATGRRPNTQGLGLEELRVDCDRGRIRVDETCRSNVPGIWAAGDVTGKVLLAHAASRQAEVVVNNLFSLGDRMRYEAVPGVIYTSPEVASVGPTEAQAREAGRDIVCAKLPMSINGRFLAENDNTRGLVKVIVDRDSRSLIGVHLIGGACSEMIYGVTAMIENELRVDEIRDLIFPHPTVAEIIRDAILTLPL